MDKAPPHADSARSIRVGEELDELFGKAREYDRLIGAKNLSANDWKRLGEVLREANRILAMVLARA
jgi:hypothetical protein